VTTRYNVWGYQDCHACKITDKFFSKKNNIEYNAFDLNLAQNEKTLTNMYPQFKKDKSTPVIQKCTLDNDGKVTNCTFVQGFRQEDYE